MAQNTRRRRRAKPEGTTDRHHHRVPQAKPSRVRPATEPGHRYTEDELRERSRLKRQIPFLATANFLKKILYHPCATPNPIIMIETAFEAAAPLLFVPFTFACSDWVKSAVGISWKCGRKIKATAKAVYGPRFVDGVHWFYEESGLRSYYNIQWNMLIAEMGLGFVADWSTLMMQAQGCETPGVGYIRTGLTTEYHDAGFVGDVHIEGAPDNPCVLLRGDEIQVLAGCEVTISYEITWVRFHNLPGPGPSVRSWITDDTGRQISVSTTVPDPVNNRPKTGGGINALKGRFGSYTAYRIRYEILEGLVGIESGSLSISASGRPMPLIPAGCFSSLGRKLGIG